MYIIALVLTKGNVLLSSEEIIALSVQQHTDACEISWSEAALTHGHSRLYTHRQTETHTHNMQRRWEIEDERKRKE